MTKKNFHSAQKTILEMRMRTSYIGKIIFHCIIKINIELICLNISTFLPKNVKTQEYSAHSIIELHKWNTP